MKKCKNTIAHELKNIGISFLSDDYIAIAVAKTELQEKENFHQDAFIEEVVCISWNLVNTKKGEHFLCLSMDELITFWFLHLDEEVCKNV